MGSHRKPDDAPPGGDKLYPMHSAEDMAGETGMVTRTDLQRLAGIVPRDTPPGGMPVTHPPHRRRIEEKAPRGYESGVYRDEEPGRSVDPPLRSRIVAIIVIIVILVTVILALGGLPWVS